MNKILSLSYITKENDRTFLYINKYVYKRINADKKRFLDGPANEFFQMNSNLIKGNLFQLNTKICFRLIVIPDFCSSYYTCKFDYTSI